MGAFKPLLPFGSQTVVEACVGYLLAGGVEELVVVLGHRREEMERRLARQPVSLALNTEVGSEMGVSIARGVEQLSPGTRAILIALVDQPAVPGEVPRALIEAWRARRARLLVPEYGGRGGHPVLLDASLRAELLKLAPEHGLRALFDAHKPEVKRVPVRSPFIARDMDTWDDYSALYEEVFGEKPPGGPTA
jgi:molybdenum cofactor cytidylyltransferase